MPKVFHFEDDKIRFDRIKAEEEQLRIQQMEQFKKELDDFYREKALNYIEAVKEEIYNEGKKQRPKFEGCKRYLTDEQRIEHRKATIKKSYEKKRDLKRIEKIKRDTVNKKARDITLNLYNELLKLDETKLKQVEYGLENIFKFINV